MPNGKIIQYNNNLYNTLSDRIASYSDIQNCYSGNNKPYATGIYYSIEDYTITEVTINLGFTPSIVYLTRFYQNQNHIDFNNHVTGWTMINTIHTNQNSYAAITTNGIILHNYTGNYAIFTGGWNAMYIAFK